MKLITEKKASRIDKYLSEETEYSRSQIQKMIDAEYILVNNKKVKASDGLKIGDEITIKEGFIQPLDLKPEDIALKIAYEDDDLMIIDKPSGMVVHPGNGQHSGTLANALVHYTKSLSDVNGEFRPGIVHRIDKETSGLVIIAKNNKTHELLAADLEKHLINREYIALLVGEIPMDNATIDAPIGRDPKDRKKMTVTDMHGKAAITHLKVVQRYQGYTLVQLNLETGRTHQIRVHTKYIGYPVYNDPVYGKRMSDFGQFLHAGKLVFIHPKTKKEMIISSELPSEIKEFLKTLKPLN